MSDAHEQSLLAAVERLLKRDRYERHTGVCLICGDDACGDNCPWLAVEKAAIRARQAINSTKDP